MYYYSWNNLAQAHGELIVKSKKDNYNKSKKDIYIKSIIQLDDRIKFPFHTRTLKSWNWKNKLSFCVELYIL